MTVVSGTISQADNSFRAIQRGSQCSAIAAVACCKLLQSIPTGPDWWMSDDIDECVRVGDALYTTSLTLRASREQEKNYFQSDQGYKHWLALDEIHCIIPFPDDEVCFHIDLETSIHGNLRGHDELLTLPAACQLVFREHQAAILVTCGFSIAVFYQSDTKVWLFDSHERGADGLHCEGGTAVLVRLQGVAELEAHVLRLYATVTGRRADFHLAGIELLGKDLSEQADDAVSLEGNTSWASDFSERSLMPLSDWCWELKDRSFYGPELLPGTPFRPDQVNSLEPVSAWLLYSTIVKASRQPARSPEPVESEPPPSPQCVPDEWPSLPESPYRPMSPWPWRERSGSSADSETGAPASSAEVRVPCKGCRSADTRDKSYSSALITSTPVASPAREQEGADDLLAFFGDGQAPGVDDDEEPSAGDALAFLIDANLTCHGLETGSEPDNPELSLSMISCAASDEALSVSNECSFLDSSVSFSSKRRLSKADKKRLKKQQSKERTKRFRGNERYRRQETEANAQRMREKRAGRSSYRAFEAETNAQRIRAARENEEFRRRETEAAAQRMRDLRREENYREEEAYRTRERRSAYDLKERQYWENIKEGPVHICCCCGQLWFRKSVRTFTAEVLASKNPFDKWQDVCVHREDEEGDDQYTLCRTCTKYLVEKKKVPPLALVNGLDFPPVPEELRDLNPLEERLVSARLPFMQIRKLGAGQQFGLKGNCVNVPIDVNTSVSVLPRMPEDAHVIHVQVMRRMSDQHPYAFDRVRPNVVFRAARYLVQQPLYQKHGIALSEEWLMRFVEETRRAEEAADEEVVHDSAAAPGQPAGELDFDLLQDEQLEPTEDDLVREAQETLLDDIVVPDISEGIRIAPGEGRIPISLLFDEDVAELSFPTIYCGRAMAYKSALSMASIVKAEARLYDRRCATNITKMMLSFCRLRRQKLAKRISLAVRKKRAGSRQLTVRDAVNPDVVGQLVQQNDGYHVLQVDRASPAFWEAKKKTVFAMVRQFGYPTLFMTTSCAEARWPELMAILKKTVDRAVISIEEAANLTWQEKARLVQSDPYTVARYCQEKFEQVFNLILTLGGPLAQYLVKHFYVRVEFQHRGTGHFHFLLWLQGAPLFNPDDPESWQRVIDFIDSLITCYEDPELPELMAMQFHRHTRTCRRQVRGLTVCRFGVPFPPMRKTCILAPLSPDVSPDEGKRLSAQWRTIQQKLVALNADRQRPSFDELLDIVGCTEEKYLLALRSTLKKHRVFLRRDVNEIKLNAYIKKLIQLLNANMDAQFILDAFTTVAYVVDYLVKPQRGLSDLIRETAERARQGNTTVKEQLRQISNVFINKSEVSAQEVAYHNLSMPLSKCSEAEQYINTSPPTERTRLLKSQAELERLLSENPDSDAIFTVGLIEHYVERPDELENISLADFSAWYQYSKKKAGKNAARRDRSLDDGNEDHVEDGEEDPSAGNYQPLKDKSGYVRKRTKPRVIRFRNYSPAKNPDDFMREQLMLFTAWRDEADLTSNLSSLFARNAEAISANRANYVKKDINLNEILEEVLRQQANEEGEAGEDEERVPAFAIFELEDGRQADIGLDVAPDVMNVNAPQSERFLLPRMQSQDDYLARVALLNDKQRRFHDNVVHRLKTRPNEQMLYYVSGGAGVGKSMLVEVLTQSIMRVHIQQGGHPDDLVVVLTAYTGKAAFRIHGVTLCSGFHIFNQNESMALSDDALNSLRAEMCNVKVLIIDEISMVGRDFILKVNRRLQQIFGNKEVLGGLSVIVLGDFNQLRPVGDGWIFMAGGDDLSQLAGPYIWRRFQHYALTEIMRQRDDRRFAEALNRLAVGCTTPEDDAMFTAREVHRLHQQGVQVPEGAVHLFVRNIDVRDFNNFYLNGLDTEACECGAADHCEGEGNDQIKRKQLDKVRSLDNHETQGLPTSLVGKIGALYMMTVNVNTKDGLTNGATGTMRKIVWGVTANNVRVPLRLYLEFGDEAVGRQARCDNAAVMRRDGADPAWTPVERISRRIIPTKGSTFTVVRIQFPLVPAKAITVYKSQGSTLESAVVHFPAWSRAMPRASMYVAFSRVTALEGLYIDGLYRRPNPPATGDAVAQEIRRLNEPETQVELAINFPELLAAEGKSIALFHNIRSLHKHHGHVARNTSYTSCDVIMLCETWTKPDDDIALDGFVVMHRRDCVKEQRHAYGTVLYVRDSLAPSVRIVFAEDSFTNIRGSQLHSFIDVVGFVIEKIDSIIGVIFLHKSPKCPVQELRDYLGKCLASIKRFNAPMILVAGDFNLNVQDEATRTSLYNYMSSLSFQFCLNETAVSTDNATLIDLLFSNIPGARGHLTESMISDHKPLWFSL